MPRKRQSRQRLDIRVAAPVVGVGMLAAALVLISATFDYARLRGFPNTAATTLAPCCRLAPFKPEKQPVRSLGEAPLAAFPFWDASKQAQASGDVPKARLLAREALHRDPRLADVRLWSAQDAIGTGHFDAAIGHLDWLYEIAPDARPGIATAIAQLAMLPAARRVVERRAAFSPPWLPLVISDLIKLKADPGIVFRVSGGSDVRSGLQIGDKSAILRDLIARKDYDRAYLAWVANLAPDAVGSVGYVYDQDFKKLPGLQPFNWSLLDSDVASVDYVSGGGVAISYFGNGQARFLEQTLTLPPGAFRLRLASSLSSEGEASKATWTITCAAGGNQPLLSAPVPARPSMTSSDFAFQVPQDCPIQTLTLEGAPSEYPATTDIKITSVAVVKAGAAS